MTPNQFRRIALGFTGAVEGTHMKHPDFRAPNGKIFASLNEDLTRGTAALTPESQADLVARAPDTFVPAAGAWGRGGWTMVVLAKADSEIVGEALTLAYQRIAASKPSRSAKATAAKRSAARHRRITKT